MYNIFDKYLNNINLSGNLDKDIYDFFIQNKCELTLSHSIRVSNKAQKLCSKYGISLDFGKQCGLLHDISAVIPNDERINVARALNIELCDEEIELPLIIHQKISAVMAYEIFNIRDNSVLNAIECHTTLKSNYTILDLILFISDKIEWDQPGKPVYLNGLLNNLDSSLEKAAFYYIEYLLNNDIQVIHPWLKSAYIELKSKLYK